MFDTLEHAGASELHCCTDPDNKLRAIVALHSTRAGPALGGCRFLPYPSDEAAIADAIRLAQGMSFKAALAGLPFGGGKAVILRPADRFDRTLLFQAFGRFVNNLGGRYITAVDSGTNLADMDQVACYTRHVSGRHGDGLDPSPDTARSVLMAMRAAVMQRVGRTSLQGLSVALQGVGNVGWELAEMLTREGARLVIADRNVDRLSRAVARFRATATDCDQIFLTPCDIFAPCALGGVINDQTVPLLRCRIVCGSANNQLARHDHADLLHRRGILYVPDYVANAGGLIRVALGYTATGNPALRDEEIRARTDAVGDTVSDILKLAEQEQCSPEQIADRLARQRLGASTANSPQPMGGRHALRRHAF